MLKKRLLAIALAIVIIFSASGCEWLRDYALGPSQGTPEVSALPTLPHKNADLIPLSVFTSYAEYTAPILSPDGSMILYRHINGFLDDVIARDWKTGRETVVSWPQVQGNPWFMWAPDGKTVLFFVDNNGDENYGLYTSDIETGDTKTVLPAGANNCYYVADNKRNGNEIYIMLLNRGTKLYDLYLIDYKTGEKTLALKNPGKITDCTFDMDGNLRAVTMTDDRAGKHVWTKNGISNNNTVFSEKEWTEIKSW